ncbi:Cyclin, N-terminal domain-containing protein [Phascolomyces articulosus]|uniref:Cyclin, N-terminal domain-containing protein n=1 Tax=Phascolomyces articulosus TaxID=60185 RepID=A0AAD5K9D9_9FUNG|nr:Cyclin, N-terminal domain-containing protein [Phascolomyces articulosus]
MLITPPTTSKQMHHIPPGFIDFTSSSFDAIFYQHEHHFQPSIKTKTTMKHPDNNNNSSNNNTTPSSDNIRLRTSHLPDLLPFIEMITEKCRVEPVQLIMALIYVQRFRASLPSGYKAESEAAHRIFAASLLIASKYSEDHYLSTKQLVRATGDVWSIKEMTRMELALLRFLQWDLHIDSDEIASFLRNLNFDASIVLSPQEQLYYDTTTMTTIIPELSPTPSSCSSTRSDDIF